MFLFCFFSDENKECFEIILMKFSLFKSKVYNKNLDTVKTVSRGYVSNMTELYLIAEN